jgi:hypothetical protein
MKKLESNQTSSENGMILKNFTKLTAHAIEREEKKT